MSSPTMHHDPLARQPAELRRICVAALKKEIAAAKAGGRKESWAAIRACFPGLRPRTFADWVTIARSGEDPPPSRAASKKARAKAMAKEAAKHLPAAPSPSFLLRDPENAPGKIDLLLALNEIYADALMLRNHAVNAAVEAGEGRAAKGETVKNAGLLMNTVLGRLKVVETALKLQEAIYDLTQMQDYYDMIIKIILVRIGPMNVEIKEQIIADLRALNARYMMTPDADAM